MEQMNITGGAHLARALKAEGITRVFGIPGTHNLEIFAQLSAHDIDVVSPRHEQGAGYMADGAARVTGDVHVVVTTTGPAALNALTALLQSFTDFDPRPPHRPGHAAEPPRPRQRTPPRSPQPIRGTVGGAHRGPCASRAPARWPSPSGRPCRPCVRAGPVRPPSRSRSTSSKPPAPAASTHP
jgi:hypothetical protein